MIILLRILAVAAVCLNGARAVETCTAGDDNCVTETFYVNKGCTIRCTLLTCGFGFIAGSPENTFPVQMCDDSCTLAGGLCLADDVVNPGQYFMGYNDDGKLIANQLCSDEACSTCGLSVAQELPSDCIPFTYKKKDPFGRPRTGTYYVKFEGTLTKLLCAQPNAYGNCGTLATFTSTADGFLADTTCTSKTSIYNFPFPAPCTESKEKPGTYQQIKKPTDTSIEVLTCTDEECADCKTTEATIPVSACLSNGDPLYNYKITATPASASAKSSYVVYAVIVLIMATVVGCVFMAFRQQDRQRADSEVQNGDSGNQGSYKEMSDMPMTSLPMTSAEPVHAYPSTGGDAVRTTFVQGSHTTEMDRL
jgi:hypothetical protein